jgi:hypothetical protein
MADANLNIVTSLVDNASAGLANMGNSVKSFQDTLASVKKNAQDVALGFGIMGAAIVTPIGIMVKAASDQQVATEGLNTALNAMKEAGIAATTSDSTLTNQKKRLTDQITANEQKIADLTSKVDRGKISWAAYSAEVDKLNQSNSTFQTKIDNISNKIANASLNVDLASKSFQDLADKNTALGFSITESEQAFTVLLGRTGSVTGSMNLMNEAMDVSRFFHMSLTDAATALGNIYAGNTRGLVQFGLSMKDNLTPAQALDLIQQKIGKSGEAAANYSATFAGQMAVTTAETNKLEITLGSALLPTLNNLLQLLQPIILAVNNFAKSHAQLTQNLMIGAGVVGIASLAIAGLAAGVIALTIILYPINLAIIAIVATLGLLGYTVYTIGTNWKLIWAGIVADFTDKINIIKRLIGDVMGPLNAVGSFVGGAINGAGSALKSVLNVHDAVITPSGQVIQTDPADYLFATKNPGNMGGSGSLTININNGMFIDQNQARIFANVLAKMINHNNKLTTI